jgi:hypothetical protein
MRARVLLLAPLFAACAAQPPVMHAAAPPPTPTSEVAAAPDEPAPTGEAIAVDALEAQALATMMAQQGTTAGPSRAMVAPESFRLDALPVGSLPEPLPASAAPTVMPADKDAEDVVLEANGHRWVRPKTLVLRTSLHASIAGQALGRMKIGFSEAPLGDPGSGVYVACGGSDASKRPVPARWETLESGPDGSLVMHVTNAWFDASSCRFSVVSRASVTAKPLANGIMFAYRQTCAACASGESLVAILPRATHLAATAVGGEASQQQGAFTRVALPLRRGGGGSILTRIAPDALLKWSQTVAPNVPSDAGEAVSGLEITQGVDEPTATAIVYVSFANGRPPPAPPFPAAAPKPLTITRVNDAQPTKPAPVQNDLLNSRR